jgi:hypothetical protein
MRERRHGLAAQPFTGHEKTRRVESAGCIYSAILPANFQRRDRSSHSPINLSNMMSATASKASREFFGSSEAAAIMRTAIEPGSAIKARIAEKGFFLFRVNEDLTGGVELSDPQTPVQTPDETGR